ncbi:helix-turn-helix transcriptional regulator [Bradyrhizobium sp. BR 10261]|uniref:helix-turn-helix domain-containing protein n=1 Tax=Bradyrhizobium sp. BR 10261 TaxID=2749992 RepID=UPI001C64BD6E|nr:helix-turn-helix transcriptional regulator [Bradyrhizobium sp. BR 10261]MBW7967143.1 helix-turn-helix transcriptional regulator [Bradyrhizobium sp. BR 10261]
MSERVPNRNNRMIRKAAQELAETLEQHRLDAELTKQAFAEKLGISKQFLHELLNGEGNPTLETLDVMASKLDLEFHPTFLRAKRRSGDKKR